jgi:hypothetical protein
MDISSLDTIFRCFRCGSDLRLRVQKIDSEGRRFCLSCTGPRCPVDGCPVRWRDGDDRMCVDHRLDDETLGRIVAAMFGNATEEG